MIQILANRIVIICTITLFICMNINRTMTILAMPPPIHSPSYSSSSSELPSWPSSPDGGSPIMMNSTPRIRKVIQNDGCAVIYREYTSAQGLMLEVAAIIGSDGKAKTCLNSCDDDMLTNDSSTSSLSCVFPESTTDNSCSCASTEDEPLEEKEEMVKCEKVVKDEYQLIADYLSEMERRWKEFLGNGGHARLQQPQFTKFLQSRGKPSEYQFDDLPELIIDFDDESAGSENNEKIVSSEDEEVFYDVQDQELQDGYESASSEYFNPDQNDSNELAEQVDCSPPEHPPSTNITKKPKKRQSKLQRKSKSKSSEASLKQKEEQEKKPPTDWTLIIGYSLNKVEELANKMYSTAVLSCTTITRNSIKCTIRYTLTPISSLLKYALRICLPSLHSTHHPREPRKNGYFFTYEPQYPLLKRIRIVHETESKRNTVIQIMKHHNEALQLAITHILELIRQGKRNLVAPLCNLRAEYVDYKESITMIYSSIRPETFQSLHEEHLSSTVSDAQVVYGLYCMQVLGDLEPNWSELDMTMNAVDPNLIPFWVYGEENYDRVEEMLKRYGVVGKRPRFKYQTLVEYKPGKFKFIYSNRRFLYSEEVMNAEEAVNIDDYLESYETITSITSLHEQQQLQLMKQQLKE